MDKTKMFEGFDEKTAERYSKEAQERWGDLATQSQRLWKSYSKEKQEEILQEADQVYQNIAQKMNRGPKSPEVQELLKQWHQNLYYFYEPSIELLGGLGNTYHDDPRFRKTFEKIHPDLPGFLKEAIATYVDTLETAWLERELGILEESE